jgi:hypothetical protein
MKIKHLFLLIVFFAASVLNGQNAYNNALILKEQKDELSKLYPTVLKQYFEFINNDLQQAEQILKIKRDSIELLKIPEKKNYTLINNLVRDTIRLLRESIKREREKRMWLSDSTQLAFATEFIRNPYSTAIELPDSFNLKSICSRLELLQSTMLADNDKLEMMRDLPTEASNMQRIGTQLRGIPSLNLLSPTQMIDGIALFLRDRIVEELNMAFLGNFRDNMSSTNGEYLRTILPKSFETLRGYSEIEEQMMSVNNVLRTAFYTDLEALPENLENLLLKVVKTEEKNQPNVSYYVLPVTIIRNALMGNHPAKIFNEISDKYFANDYNNRFARVMHFMTVLNEDLIRVERVSENKNMVWVSPIDWQQNFSEDAVAQKYFMGLVFQKCRKMKIGIASKDTFQTIMSKHITEYIDLLNGLDNNYDKIIETKSRSLRDSFMLDIAWQSVKMIDRDFQTYNTLFTVQDDISKWRDYKPIAESTLSMFSSIRRKNYGSAVLSAYSVVSKVLLTSDVNSKFLRNFLFYGSFVSDVLTANNADDVRFVLSRYSAPSGSYTVKRRASWTVSINAYPGLFGGIEFATVDSVRNSGIMGVTAPIGLSISTNTLTKRGSWSLFMPIIDIGAVLSYRFKNDDYQGLPDELTWAQVLSPGLFANYGFRKLPLSLGFGWQLSPKLRQIKNQNLVFNPIDFGRFSVNTTVDIPIFYVFRSANK